MFARVDEVRRETHDVKTLLIEPEEWRDFIPGQFAMVHAKIGDGQESRRTARAYSIASSPSDNRLAITFRLYEDGKISPYLWNLEKGDIVEIDYPFGRFKLEDGRKSVFIAGGTGIAPIRSMALSCEESGEEFSLLATFRTEKDIIFKEDLNRMGADIVITSERDRIGKADLEKYNKDSVFYICGSPEMANGIESLLIEVGVPKDNIRTEKW